MKRTILILLLVSHALMLCAESFERDSASEPVRIDTMRVIDTVWVRKTAMPVEDDISEQPVVVSSSFSRGIGRANSLFLPKGSLGFGLSVSHSDYKLGTATDDVGYKMLFSLLNGVTGNMTSFGLSPQLSYCVADNLTVGLRFDYDKSSFNLGSASFSLGDMMSFDISNMNYIKQSYSGAATLRYYMPISDSRRFAIFLEGRGVLGYAQSKTFKQEEEHKFGTYQDIYNASLELVPGIICFMADNASFEVSIGVLGFETQKVQQVTNQVEYSEMKQSGANFKINLLSINFGMSFYIYPKGKG